MKKIIINLVVFAAITTTTFAKDIDLPLPTDNRLKELATIEAIDNAFTCGHYICLSGEFTQKLNSDYYQNTQFIQKSIDNDNFVCLNTNKSYEIIQLGIATTNNKKLNISVKTNDQLAYVKNRTLNELYIPFCSATLEKSIGSLSFSKKNITGVGSAYNNQNYCGNFHKYLIHLSTESNDMKYSFGTFISRFSTENLKVHKNEKDLHIQAKAFLKYMSYGNIGFDPIMFAEIYTKNNQSSASKIGGRDGELEIFMTSIIAGNFKIADDILKDNIENSKKIFELIDNSDNCDFNNIVEIVIPRGYSEVSKSDIKAEDLNFVYRNNNCVPFNEFISGVAGNQLTPIESLDYMINLLGKNTKIAEVPGVIYVMSKNSNMFIYRDSFTCKMVNNLQ